jgi:hypothetical protein
MNKRQFKKGDVFESTGTDMNCYDVKCIIVFDRYLSKKEKTEHWDCVIKSDGILIMYDTKSLIEEDKLIFKAK